MENATGPAWPDGRRKPVATQNEGARVGEMDSRVVIVDKTICESFHKVTVGGRFHRGDGEIEELTNPSPGCNS